LAIVVNLDVVLARRKKKLVELSNEIGISVPNLSVLRSGRARAIRFSTLELICASLGCQPGELLEYSADDDVA
jgi:putative transcriptional regulator